MFILFMMPLPRFTPRNTWHKEGGYEYEREGGIFTGWCRLVGGTKEWHVQTLEER